MSRNEPIVFFDLETTGLDTDVCHIIQLAAICKHRVFNVYILPRRAPTPGASLVTGFALQNGCLYRHGAPLRTSPLAEALAAFIHFLSSFRRPVLLAAHNARRFDVPVLHRVLQQCSLWQEFQPLVYGFLDTFLLSKNLFDNLASYSQEKMVEQFLGKRYDAHNAMEDVKVLQELFKNWNPSKWDISHCTFRGNYLALD